HRIVRPERRIVAGRNIRFVVATKVGKVGVANVDAHALAGIRKEHIVNERDRSGSAVNVEENPSLERASRHYLTNECPKHTASNLSSTPLSVYQGVQPAGS